MLSRIISDLIGTLRSTFRIATSLWKDNAGVLQARDKNDTNFIPVGATRVDHEASTGFKVSLEADSPPANVTFKLPDTDGSTDQAIVTDGAGKLSFATVGVGNNQSKTETETIVFNSSSPVTIFTPPPNAFITFIIVDVEIVFNGASPTLEVGVAGTPDRYMDSLDNKLKIIAIYEVLAMYEEDGTPEPVIITYIPSGSTAGQARVTVIYANPG